MKNLTLALDERLLTQSREYAQSHGTTINAMVRRFLQQTVGGERPTSGLAEFFRLADEAGASAPGYVFDREEIYEHLYAD